MDSVMGMAKDSSDNCVYLCYVEDLHTARRKAARAEDTSDLDTAASDVEKVVSRRRRARNLLSDDENENVSKSRIQGKKIPVPPKKDLLPLPPPPPITSSPAGPSCSNASRKGMHELLCHL